MDIRKSIVGICASAAGRKLGFDFAGTGFLISGGLLVTCAHVADGAKRDGDKIFFRVGGSTREYAALKTAESPSYEWDALILKPESLPDGMDELPLWGGETPVGSDFATFGYVQVGGLDALHAHGTILGLTSIFERDYLQLAPIGQRELDKGYSGAPLWVNGLGVVGIVKRGMETKADGVHSLRTHQDTSFAVPATALKSFYDNLEFVTERESPAVTARFVPEKQENPDELPQPGNLPPGSRMLFHRNAVFTGRESDLLALAHSLLGEEPVSTRTTAATGMGGVGKTQLAVEFCYRCGRFFYGVHWINAAGGALESEIAACGREMRLQGFPEKQPDQVALTLQAWQDQPRRLVVLDNLEDQELLADWLPRLNGLSLLVTSRRQAWSADLGLEVREIGTLARPESLSLLRKLALRLKTSPDGDLDKVAERLGDLPLALDLAGRYLADVKSISPAAFLDEIEREGGALKHSALSDWAESNPTGHDINMAATFMLSWNQLGQDQDQELARKLFTAAGYLAPNVPIPLEIFEALAGDPKSGARALRPLLRLGLLKAETNSIHPLLAEFARSQAVGTDVLEELAGTITDISSQAIGTGLPAEFASFRPHLAQLAPAVEAAGLEISGWLWNNLGRIFEELGEPEAAKAQYERALAVDEQTFGKEHSNVAMDANNLGSAMQDLGDLVGAKALYEQALEIYEKTFGMEHPEIARVASNLGNVLYDLGDLAGAKAQIERALSIDEKIFGKEHADTAKLLVNLGVLLQDLGDLEAARTNYERALAIDEQIYGMEHPEVALAASCLGTVLQELGDLQGAKAQIERALAIGEQTYGKEHPLVARFTNYLGSVLQDLGDLEGARKNFERALAINEQIFGLEHPQDATYANSLGTVLKDLGDLEGARKNYERALAIDEQAYGLEHPQVAIYANNLGGVLQDQGDLKGARTNYERALAIVEKTYGKGHAEVAKYANNLGMVLKDLGDLRGAQAQIGRALAIDEKTYGPDHPQLVTYASNLGGVLRALGDLPGARTQFSRALVIVEQVYGKGHSFVAKVAINLGGVLRDLGDLEGAKSQYERALAIDEQTYGKEHHTVARVASNLGGVLRDLGDLQGARTLFSRALAIDEQTYGKEHLQVARDASNLGGILRELGDLAGAKPLCERALAIDEQIYGKEHPEVARDASNLGIVLQGLGDLPEAKALYLRSLAIVEQTYGKEHSLIARIAINLGSVLQGLGDLEGAKSQYMRALAILRTILPPWHSTIQTVQGNLNAVEELIRNKHE